MISSAEYVTFVDNGDGTTDVTVHDLEAGTSAPSCTVNVDLEEVKCDSRVPAKAVCYAVDINLLSVITVDPRTCKIGHVLTFDPLLWNGILTDSSALDASTGTYYFALSGPRGTSHLVAANIGHKTLAKLPDSFNAGGNNSGPLCFDPLLGLLSLGHPGGGVVALNTTTQAVSVLFDVDLGGLVTDAGLACMHGVLVAGIVDFWRPRASPTLLVAVDFTVSPPEVFHNSTAKPEFHALHLAYRPSP
jgi:hypothetical protein